MKKMIKKILINKNDSGIYIIEGRKDSGFVVMPTGSFRIPEYKKNILTKAINDYMSEFKR